MRYEGLIGLVLAGLVAGCADTARRPAAVPRHLILVTIDTLRADRLGVYGAKMVATPRLDAIARDGIFAHDASAHVPLTLPSHVSLMTGLLPTHTGIHDNLGDSTVPPVPLLAEVLHRAGFATGGFVSSVVLSSSSGLHRGFDTYRDDVERAPGATFLSSVRKRGDTTTAQAIDWLDTIRQRSPQQRAFLWLHLFDAHDPYAPPEPYASRYAGHPYDGAVAWSDELIGRLDDAITRLGLQNDTLFVITSDHGEGLGDHGELLHGFFVYQSTLRVPWLARGPGIPHGSRLDTTLRLVDVLPTVLDLLNVSSPADTRFDGRSLATALRHPTAIDDAIVYAETLIPRRHFGWSDLRVLREGRWKYIQAPRPELYDVVTDPAEERNLVDPQASRAQAMRAGLAKIIATEQTDVDVAAAGARSIPSDVLQRLGALGYVHADSTSRAAPGSPGLADPKDKIEEFRASSDLIRDGLIRLDAREYPASIAAFRKVLALGVDGFEVHLFLGKALAASGEPREAAMHFGVATERASSQLSAWEGLVDALIAANDREAALRALDRGRRVLPDAVSLRLREARLLRDLGRRKAAIQAYEHALPFAEREGSIRCELGEVMRDAGDIRGAIATLQEGVHLDRTSAECWNSLAVTLGGARRVDEAERAFRQAVALDPNNHYYSYNLGFLLLQYGRTSEAREWFEKSAAANPHFDAARQRLAELARSRRPAQ